MFAARKKITLLTLGLFLLYPLFTPAKLAAQNTGDPFFQRVGYYTMAGGGLGALAGAAVWLTDPAGKDSNLGKSMLLGLAVGVIAGAAFGIYQTSQQVEPHASAWEQRLEQIQLGWNRSAQPALWQTALYRTEF